MAQKKSPPPRAPLFIDEETWELHPMWSQFFENLITAGFVDRGDPAAYDFTSFTTDGTWRDLDLSSVVPVGAKAVALNLHLLDDAAGSQVAFREKGNTNELNVATQFTQVANVGVNADLVVICNADRVIQYIGDNVTFTRVWVTVKGWWL